VARGVKGQALLRPAHGPRHHDRPAAAFAACAYFW
jgi:hypothetical protein